MKPIEANMPHDVWVADSLVAINKNFMQMQDKKK